MPHADGARWLGELERQSYREFVVDRMETSALERLFATLDDERAKAVFAAGELDEHLSVFVHVKGGGDSSDTIYRYDWPTHRLVDARAVTGVGRMFSGTPNERIYEPAAFSAFLFARTGDRDAVIASGYVAQALMNQSARLGIGLCPIGTADAGVLTAQLPFLRHDELVYILLGGRIAAEQTLRWSPPRFGGRDDATAAWQAFARRKLPYYMVPQTFVALDRLPLSANAKIDRAALPRPGPIAGAREHVEPRTALEFTLAKAWMAVLNQDRVGIRDNFFELGGNSLDAMKLAAAVRRQTGRHLPLRDLFRLPTIEQCAEFLSQQPMEHGASSLVVDADRDRWHEPFPLTPVQQAYWLGRSGSFLLGNTSVHRYVEFDLPHLDLERLDDACNRLIARHAMLRSIVTRDGLQRVLPHVPRYEVRCLDLRASADATERLLAATRDDMSHQLFGVTAWPLFDLRATRIRDDLVRLHVSIELINVDAYSVQILAGELSAFYDNPAAELPPLDITFRDYVVASERIKVSPAYERSRRYWLDRLDTLPSAPDLPLASHPSAISSPRFHRQTRLVGREAWARLKDAAARMGVTTTGLLVTAFSEVLERWANQSDFTLNITLFDRMPLHADVMSLVGDFTSLTLLEIHGAGSGSFRDRSRRIQEQLWESLEHRFFGGVEVIRELNRRSCNRRGASMPVVFTFVPERPRGAISGFARLLAENEGYGVSQTPQVWLDNQAIEGRDGLRVNWDAVAGLFPAGVVEAMFSAYCALLDRLAAGIELAEAVDVIPNDQIERRRIVNATSVRESDDLLHSLFWKRAQEHPEKPAIVSPTLEISYARLHHIATTIAAELTTSGVRPHEIVAVVMEKGWEQSAAVLGVLYAGAAYLPIDARLPPLRLRQILEQADVRVALVQPSADPVTVPDSVRTVPVTGDIGCRKQLDPPAVAQKNEDLAYVIFTSGSTGTPKGVMIDHRGAVNTILDINRRFDVTARDRVLALSSLDFDLSVYDIFGTLAAGGTIVVPDAAHEREPSHWHELVRSRGVTVWNSVPALARQYVDFAGAVAVPDAGLRLIMLSGDWIPLDLPAQLQSLHPGAELISLGGATEASIWSIVHRIGSLDPAWKSIPYGTPLSNQACHVLRRADLAACPDFAIGDLYIGGLGLARGYWRDDEATAASFIRHPRTNERLYRTGDLARYWPDGTIELLGRADTQVKLHGHRIELGEIEAVLAEHDRISAAAVVLHDEGADRKSLLAYVTPRDAAGEGTTSTATPDGPRAGALETILGDVEADVRSVGDTADETELARTVCDQNERYLASVLRLLRSGEVFQRAGDARSVDEVLARCRMAPRYSRWLKRALDYLVERGLLQHDASVYRSGAELPHPAVADAPIDLPAILSETVHSAALYADAGTAEDYQKYFAQCHDTLRIVFEAAVRRADGNAPLSVLEVGAGLGSLTRHLLPVLDRRDATYVFTDISRYFLQDARQAFDASRCVEYQRLDLEHEPAVQGFTPHSFDVIVAASVLHVMSDVRRALRHIRSLLKPGGLLLLIEETKFFPFYDLTMGLQQGFDSFADSELRQEHPLIDRRQWEVLLAEAGFSGTHLLTSAGSFADYFGLDAMVAQGGALGEPFDVEDVRRYAEARLPRYMVPRQIFVLDSMPLSRNGKIDRQALPRPDRGVVAAASAYVAPRHDIDRRLCELVAANLDVEAVGIHHDYFELGGDSLLAVRLINRIRDEMGVDVPIRALFEHPTVAGLADVLHDTGAHTGPIITAADRTQYLLR